LNPKRIEEELQIELSLAAIKSLLSNVTMLQLLCYSNLINKRKPF